jgi:hypothetical protein
MKTAIALSAALMCGCSGATISGFDAAPTFAVCNLTNDAGADAGTVNVQAQTAMPWVLTKPRLHLIFWGDWWINSGLQQFQQMSQEWQTVGNDPNFYSPLAPYGIQTGSLEGIFNTNWNVPVGALKEDYIQQELLNEISNGDLPAADFNSLYVIMFPQGTQAKVDVVGNFAGRHGRVENTAYTYTEFNSEFQVMGEVASHEILEGISDPTDGLGFSNRSAGNEIADLCENVGAYQLDGYPITKIWDQSQCRCVP